jgi:DNA-binding MarR family transcriptional regulator
LDDETKQAAIRLQNLATRLLRLARSSHGKEELSSAQYSAMAVLYDRGPLPLVDIARAERVAHPTMSRLVAGLERRGVVERRRNADDRRSRRVALTEAGRVLYERTCSNRVAIIGAILTQLKKETVDELLEVWGRMADPLEADLRRD